jgi:hypothetical protein
MNVRSFLLATAALVLASRGGFAQRGGGNATPPIAPTSAYNNGTALTPSVYSTAQKIN